MEFTTQTSEVGVEVEPVDPGMPVILATVRLVADGCSCVVWLGRRVDNGETTVASSPCSNELHRRMLSRFTDLMKWSASGDGSDRQLVDVCRDLLIEASTEMRIA